MSLSFFSHSSQCWYPAVDYDYDCIDRNIAVPERADCNPIKWGKTSADRLPKIDEMKPHGSSYEGLVRMAMGGDRKLAAYLTWIKNMYGHSYNQRGPSSQGIDLAGYLSCIKYVAPVSSDGFRPRFVQ